MGLMPSHSGNPFIKLDKREVIGQLKATGTRDGDVLHAQKQQMIAPAKNLKLLGLICLGGGALFTITIILAWFGIPLMIFGWWVGRFGKRNIKTVEDAFAEFAASSVSRAVVFLLAIAVASTPLFAQTNNGAGANAPRRTIAAPPADANGFKIGDTVEINTGFGWMKATILSMNGNNYRVRSQIGVEITKTYPDELRRLAPPAAAAAPAGRGAPASTASSASSRGSTPGTPPRPGFVSCAGKIEGRYTTAGLAGSLTVEFRSGKAIMKDAIGDNDTTLECWMKGDKVYLHQPGDAPSQDMPIDINDDGTLQTPIGELKKKGK